MAVPSTPARVRPCEVCGGQCGRFPDLPSDARNPFLGAKPAQPEPAMKPAARPKGKRRPVEDRARHLQEDRT